MRSILKKITPNWLIRLWFRSISAFTYLFCKLKYHPFYIRKATTDVNVFRCIFVNKEFELPVKVNPKFIIDAGAYSGLSTIYFAHKYPDAKVVAIEPERSNYNTLIKNTEKLTQVSRLNAGLWSKDAFLKIKQG